MQGSILIEFDNNETSFNVNIGKATDLFVALMGLESYIVAETGLDIVDVREIIDEARMSEEFRLKGVPDEAKIL